MLCTEAAAQGRGQVMAGVSETKEDAIHNALLEISNEVKHELGGRVYLFQSTTDGEEYVDIVVSKDCCAARCHALQRNMISQWSTLRVAAFLQGELDRCRSQARKRGADEPRSLERGRLGEAPHR